MANKNKNKSKKEHSVFRVAGGKAGKSKAKAKTVKTNLKKMNVASKAKTEKADAALKSIHEELATCKKITKEQNSDKQKKSNQIQPAADVDSAMEDFSKL